MELLIRFIVVLCELYIVVWILGFFFGLVNANWRSPMYPSAATWPGTVGSLIVAIAVVVVFGGHNFGL